MYPVIIHGSDRRYIVWCDTTADALDLAIASNRAATVGLDTRAVYSPALPNRLDIKAVIYR